MPTTWMFNFDERASGWFADMIRVAVISAREQTDLRPMCLFDGKGTPGIISWLKANGVPVIRTQVPFRDELFSEEVLAANADTGYHPQHAAGAFLRLVAADFVDDDYFLYEYACAEDNVMIRNYINSSRAERGLIPVEGE